MENNYGLDSKVLDYLIQKRKPEAMVPQGAFLGAIADASSSLGTLGGRRSDTSGIKNLLAQMDARKQRQIQDQEKRDLMSAQIMDRDAENKLKREQMIADRDFQREIRSKDLVEQREYDLKQDERKFKNQMALTDARNKSALEQFDKKQQINKADQLKKIQEKNKELYVPGIGLARTKTDAKELKDGIIEKNKFNRQLDELISIRVKNKGGTIDPNDVARAKQLSKNLLLTYKNIAKLGVLSQADEKIINAIIPSDPTAFVMNPLALKRGQDPILKQLESFRREQDQDFMDTVKRRVQEDTLELNETKIPGREYYLDLAKQLGTSSLQGNIDTNKAYADKKPDKKVLREQTSKKHNKTKYFYSDGTVEVIDGR